MFEHLMMKHLFLLFFLVVITVASALADQPPESTQEVKPFVHPGLLHSRAELDFVREKVQAGQEPWKSAWERLRSSRPHKPHRRRSRRSRDHDKERAGVSSLKYEPSPSAEVVRGPYNDPNIGSSNFSNDSMAAYSHALQWWMTGKKAHASKAIEILNAWSTTLESISGHDARLLIGMGGLGFRGRHFLFQSGLKKVRHTASTLLIRVSPVFLTRIPNLLIFDTGATTETLPNFGQFGDCLTPRMR